MVRVGVRRNLALLVLCLSCDSQCSGASVSIIERHVEPTTLVTTAATSDSEPIWLVLPMLLDVQPVLLKLDVTRHVPAQIQSFCRDHGVDSRRCVGAIREALDEVVNFQRFCKKPTAESALPGFIVTKNVLKDNTESSSASWLQNDPEDVAIDFCGFAQAKAAVEQNDKCVEALEKSLRLSFDWMLALTQCEQQAERAGDEVATADSETPSIAERLATVEEMIAALQSSSDVSLVVTSQEPIEESVDATFNAEGDVVEEISESEEAESVVSEVNNSDIQETTTISVDKQQGDELGIHEQSIELGRASLNNSDAHQRPIETEIPNTLAMRVGAGEGGITAAGNSSTEASYTPLQDKELGRIGEDLKSLKAGAALVLTLSILYLAVDLILHCVHYVTGNLGAPKQLASVVLHDILLLLGSGPRSTCKLTYKGSDDLKKPSSRRFKVTSEEIINQPKPEAKGVEKNTHDGSVKLQVIPHHSTPSFTCVAMILSITNDSIALPHDVRTQPTPNFVQDSNEALKMIQQKYDQELTAAQRIQNAWKAVQRKVLLKQEWENSFNAAAEKSDSNTPIFQLVQHANKPPAQAPRTEIVTTGLRRFVPNPLPPR
ncbi:hypothetical protein F441_02481 [Phytophthora nicotianae CJ01A1]|uniref:Uncharacterized protein n=5 Tax=Phytophthora nicotianae TaxID=4792 RepID=V9FV75_PHYNI|nr:hypothetical protein F443_02539 [Phytophthora nicotianae P1569]ETK94550.1 hypothetical protein L915_02414 [Phytophthora nicotianae]ETO83442.1 hypothetical protein F444_02534 [Phytophthora nicotianae P1976]ETP24532.1 hypothetical protein F441_02481 [Phytophthora nicotianae CJ01A1]ETP52478.1 hypothetical protein F442_02508 [Phytophthora nicotianae P10297]